MFISMHSKLGWASFCMNYCINAAWHGGNQPVALLGCNGSSGGFDSTFRSSTLILCLSTLPPDSGMLISKWKAKFAFIWKEGFGPLSNSPVLFLLSPGKKLLSLFLFQKWLSSPFPEDVWAWWLLMHWLQYQFTLCEALPRVWISFAWQYSQACGHPCCWCKFSYPISSFQFTLHLIYLETALIEQPPLSVMALCDLSSL